MNRLALLFLLAFWAAAPLSYGAPGTVTPVPDEKSESGGQQPDFPGYPGEPDSPEYPEEPEDPGYPEEPDHPERPGKPGRPGHPGHPPRHYPYIETVPVKSQFLGFARLPLAVLTPHWPRLQGWRLTAVTLYGYSQWGAGAAFFCSSSCSYPQPVGGYFGAYRIQTAGEILHPYSGNWFLELRGNFLVDSLQLEFQR